MFALERERECMACQFQRQRAGQELDDVRHVTTDFVEENRNFEAVRAALGYSPSAGLFHAASGSSADPRICICERRLQTAQIRNRAGPIKLDLAIVVLDMVVQLSIRPSPSAAPL